MDYIHEDIRENLKIIENVEYINYDNSKLVVLYRGDAVIACFSKDDTRSIIEQKKGNENG